MIVWLISGLAALAVGVVAGLLFRDVIAILVGAIIPWLGLLAAIIYGVYFVPHQGGGYALWPIAQLFGGTFVGTVGGLTAGLVSHFAHSKRLSNPKA